jgi:hypothetical protein
MSKKDIRDINIYLTDFIDNVYLTDIIGDHSVFDIRERCKRWMSDQIKYSQFISMVENAIDDTRYNNLVIPVYSMDIDTLINDIRHVCPKRCRVIFSSICHEYDIDEFSSLMISNRIIKSDTQ